MNGVEVKEKVVIFPELSEEHHILGCVDRITVSHSTV